MSTKAVWIFVAAVLTTGCASLMEQQHRSELASNQSDHEYCVKQGLHYPDANYVECRRSLQNAQLYRDWRNEQMMQARPTPVNPILGKPVTPHMSNFRPIDKTRFQCKIQSEFGGNIIVCIESPSPPA